MLQGIPRLREIIRAAVLIPGMALLGVTAARAAGPIVIGGTVSETGAFAEDAGYQLRGVELAIADANAHGGWLGRKLELKIYDDKSDPGTGVRLYTRLITADRVNLLIGPYSSGITQAVAPLINKYHMTALDPGASLPTIFNSSNKWNFQVIPSSLTYLTAVLPMAKADGAKTVAVLGLKSAFSLACYHARVAQAGKLGMKVVYKTTYSLPQPDFSAIALAIKNAHPGVVLACSYYPDAVGLTQSLHDQGFAPRFLAETIGPVEGAFYKAVGPLANRIFSNTSWWYNLQTPGNAAFIAGYKAKFHSDPDYHAAAGYTAIQVLGDAVEATKSLDQAKLRTWLLHHTVPTIQGNYKVNAHGLSIGLIQYLVQVQDGQIKMIWPAKLAQAKPEVPYLGH